jgi:hypothetical protein
MVEMQKGVNILFTDKLLVFFREEDGCPAMVGLGDDPERQPGLERITLCYMPSSEELTKSQRNLSLIWRLPK